MHKKDSIIITLLVIAIILFCILQFIVIPTNQKKQMAYVKHQTDALTHDIASIKDYKSDYIGDASNVGNLFGALPLNHVKMQFEINSETCTLTLHYLDSVRDIGEKKVQRDILYNTVAAMATIQNLSEITYIFSDEHYAFHRNKMENIFGIPLSDLLIQETWKKEVQNNLDTIDFIKQFF